MVLMAACPSCGGEISGGSCTRCGAKAAPTLDVPDLDLTPMSVPKAAPVVARRTSGPAPALADDVLAEDPGEASFELDAPMPPLTPISSKSPPAPTSGRPMDLEGLRPEITIPPSNRDSVRDPSIPPVRISHVPAASSSPPRVSRPPPEDKPRIDPVEAKRFAAYGEAPSALLQTPLYALKVKMRQSELRRELWRAKLAFERSQKERSAAEADATRLEEVRLRLTAEVAAKEHEVDLHEAALLAYDPAAVKRGVQLASTVAFVLVVLIFLPVFFRMCIGVDAPPLPQ